jgi:hypothetical protein
MRIIPFLQGDTGAEAHRGGNDVVAALPHVDMIGRMDGAAGMLTRQVYDDFVNIHLDAGARPRLEHVDRKLSKVKNSRI